jgi:hypothetical protein
LNAKPILNLWYYLVIYLTPFIPLSFNQRRGGGSRKEGLAPLLDAPEGGGWEKIKKE